MPNWKMMFLAGMLTVLSACNLSRTPPTPIVTSTAESSADTGKPAVTISSPQNGDEVVVGTDVFVSANATDDVGITRVQLIANNQIVKTVSSESITGDRNMNVLLDWRPTAAGSVTLEVIAYRGAVASDPASIGIVVRESQAQVTATIVPQTDVPVINPNDPTCRILTNVGLNVRTGPSTLYPRVTTLAAGTQVPIIGRIGDNTWWLVRYNSFSSGWVIQRNPSNPSEEFISIFGNCSAIPIISPPPPPVTLVPTFSPAPTATPIPPITNTPQPADLIVVSISGPTAVVLDAATVTKTYSIAITNNGAANTGSFTSSIQVSPGLVTPNAPVDLGVVANLAAGESIVLNQDITFTATGAYTIKVIADSNGDVTEVSEINNTGTLDVGVVLPTVTPSPTP